MATTDERPQAPKEQDDSTDSPDKSPLLATQSPGRAGFLASFRFAFAGLAYSFKTQRNFRIHVAIASLAVLAGIILGLSWVEWAVIALLVVLVLAAEMVNTMIESLVDLVTQEYHPLAKVAKDVAAGVVLLTAIGAVVVGVLIFLPKLWAIFGR
ncbi:MAG: diacylglycerol kinase family protein [Chloroflexota bacterium]